MLPVEQDHQAPNELQFSLTKIIEPEFITQGEGDDASDYVKLDENLISRSDWDEHQFNDLGLSIPRDSSQQANRIADIIRRMNDYSYGVRPLPRTMGIFARILSFNQANKLTVPSGKFGVVRSAERYLFYKPGNKTLNPVTHKVVELISQDDEAHPVRKYGDKTLLEVHANTLAGGYKIINDNGEKSYQFVLFPRGRHVINESEYKDVESVNLRLAGASGANGEVASGTLKLGPLTIAYIGEGYLGCAKEKKTGKYVILYPGPAYLLNEENHVEIQVKPINEELFKLGPYTFLTVRGGKLGGAYDKSGGFVILPHGYSYRLHAAEYDQATMIERAQNFTLGPNQFLTVLRNEVAGVYSKGTGEYITLPPGKTYQMNSQNYYPASAASRVSNKTVIGPLTYLTVPQNKMVGAYRISDGSFVKFDHSEDEYILSSTEYRDITTVDKLNYQLKPFGPNSVITVHDGNVVVFEKDGKFELLDAGNYELTPSYHFNSIISLKTFTERLGPEFKTRDGIDMKINFTLVWKVNRDQAESIAKFNGTFDDIHSFVTRRCIDNITRRCNMFDRANLRPTKQDSALEATTADELDAEALDELTKTNEEKTLELYNSIADYSATNLRNILKDMHLGIDIESVSIDSVILLSKGIMETLSQITETLLATKSQKVKGDLAVAKAEVLKVEQIKQTEAETAVKKQQALAEAEIDQERARADADITRQRAFADLEVRQKEAETDKQIKIQQLTADAEAKSKAMMIQAETEKDIAEMKAMAVKTAADAEYYAKQCQNKAAEEMSDKQVKLIMEKEATKRVEWFANAAWVNPDKQQTMLKMLGNNPNIRFGEVTLGEMMKTFAKQNKAVAVVNKASAPPPPTVPVQ